MTELQVRPEEVNVSFYSGDTNTIHVRVLDAALIAGRKFFAQVRKTRTSPKIDASFTVIPTVGKPLEADIVLFAADSQILTKRGEYHGFWDVQLAMPDGSDPITTLAFGELHLHNDVTRVKA